MKELKSGKYYLLNNNLATNSKDSQLIQPRSKNTYSTVKLFRCFSLQLCKIYWTESA